MFSFRVMAQPFTLKAEYQLQKKDRHTASLDMNIVFYNHDTLTWYYPKEKGQVFVNKHSTVNYTTAEFAGQRNLGFSFDVGTPYEMNYFDSLIAIPPGDSLSVSYTGIKVNKKNKTLTFSNYITADKAADRLTRSGNRYFHLFSSTVLTLKVKLQRRGSGYSKTIEIKKNINAATFSRISRRGVRFLSDRCIPQTAFTPMPAPAIIPGKSGIYFLTFTC